MIQDFRSASCPDALAADVCIIGAGPAGISLAMALAGSPWTVCLLEGGGTRAEAASQALYEGESVGPYAFDPSTSRLRALGGATQIWGGGCIPLAASEMAARDWVPGGGWPIGREELSPYYEHANRLCAIEPGAIEDGAYRFDGAPSMPPASPLQPRTSRSSSIDFSTYREQLHKAAGVTALLHANLLRLQATPQANAVGSALIGSTDGRRGVVRARCFVLAAGGLENARLLLLSDDVARNGLGNDHDLVGRFFMDHPRCRLGTLRHPDIARAVHRYERAQGRAATPAFHHLCLTEDAQRAHRLLHARVRPFSIERDPPEGLAAMRALRAALRRPPERDEAAQVEARLLDALEHDVPQRQTIGEGRPGPLALRSVRHADDIVRAALRKLARRPVVDADRAELVGYFEQAPNRDSRVALADSRDALGLRRIRVDWRMSAQDEENIRRASRLIGDALAADLGARFEPAGWLADPAAPLPLHGTAHHMGTTRMSDSPATGVVDAQCRVHGIDNLYVAGSSVFPTGGWSFPTLTIIALALRIGDELLRRLPDMPMVDAIPAPEPVPA